MTVEAPTLERGQRIQNAIYEAHTKAFSTECFGIYTKNPFVRALDWRPRWRSEEHIVRSLRSYVRRGVLSRRERFSEILGRIASGYFREPQGFIHVLSPYSTPPETRTSSPKENWRKYFESKITRKGDYQHRAYLLLDPLTVHLDIHKKHYLVIPDSTPRSSRKIAGLFIRKNLFTEAHLAEILQICEKAGWPVVSI